MLTDIEERLRAHGEQFMQMFDDYQPSRAPQAPQVQVPTGIAQKCSAPAAATADPLTDLFNAPRKRRKTAAGHGRAAQSATPSAGRKQLHMEPQPADAEPASQAAECRPPASTGSPHTLAQCTGRGRKNVKVVRHVDISTHRSVHASGPQLASTVAHAAAERAAFMSARTGKVHRGLEHPQNQLEVLAATHRQGNRPASDRADEDQHGNMEDFLTLRREVQHFGASALEKKDAKAYQEAYLSSLGAKKQKMRIPKNIGLAMFEKKRTQQEAALSAALEAGTLRKKDVVKQRRALKGAHSKGKKEPGLGEDAGVYKQGLLRVRPSAMPGGSKSGGMRISTEAIKRHTRRLLKM